MNQNSHSHRPILLVEDNPLDIDLTLRAFKKQGLLNPIEIARDGEEAVSWIPRWEAGEPLPPHRIIGSETAQNRRPGSAAPFQEEAQDKACSGCGVDQFIPRSGHHYRL